MEQALEIAKWLEVFETSESRRYKTLSWVSMPVSFSSSGYQSLLEEFGDKAPFAYGTWCALVAFAASCPIRGRLATSKGLPISWAHVARMSGFPVEAFESLAAWAVRPEVAWLIPAGTSEIPEETTSNSATQQSPNNHSTATQQSPCLQTQPTKQTQPTNQPDVGRKTGGLAGGPGGVSGAKTGGDAVADRLAALKASRWREAIGEAKECGCNPELALSLLDFGERGGYGVGAIICRLSKARPSLPMEAGWPDKTSQEAKQADADRKRAERAAKAHRDAEANAIIKRGRKEKLTDEAIQAELDAKGLEWPK